MINLFIGYDPREEAGTHVFISSVLESTTWPVCVTPLHLPMFASYYPPTVRDGSNAFTYTRFLVPFLQGYRGHAIFADGADMLCKADLAEMWALREHDKAVQVVKHEYRTKHPRKYIGTKMEAANEDYPRKQWSSVMLINCGHGCWRDITPERVAQMTGSELHRFSFIPDQFIGELPPIWNWLADEYGENPDAKLLHFTAGVPAFPLHRSSAHTADYMRQIARMNHVSS